VICTSAQLEKVGSRRIRHPSTGASDFISLLTRSVYHYQPVAPGSAPGIRETDRDADGRRALAMALFIKGETDEPLP